MPSTSVKCAPLAVSKKIGNEPGHLVIHAIGTPPRRLTRASLASTADVGCKAMNRSFSSAERRRNTSRSIMNASLHDRIARTSGAAPLDRTPHALRRARHVDVAHTEMGDGVHDGRL